MIDEKKPRHWWLSKRDMGDWHCHTSLALAESKVSSNIKNGYKTETKIFHVIEYAAFADQGDKIKRLEKAVELMRSGLEEVKDKSQSHADFTRNAFGCIAKETLAEVDSILKGAE